MAYPNVGSGLATQVMATSESTYGVAPSLASARCYEIKSETLELKKNTVQGQGLAAGRLYDRTKRRIVTSWDVTGNVVLDVPIRQLGFWLQYVVGSFNQTLAVPTSLGSGAYQYVFQGVGGSQTLGGLLGQSFTLQEGIPTISGAVEPFTYVGCKVTDFELKAAYGSIAEMTLGIDARNELAASGQYGAASAAADPLNGSVPALQAWNGPPTGGQGEQVFHFREATIYTGYTYTYASHMIQPCSNSSYAAGNIKDIDLKHVVKLENNRYFAGNQGFKAEQIENGFRGINGTFTIEWLSSEAMYQSFQSDTTTSLECSFVGPTIGGSYTYLLDVIIPNIKLEGESPKVPGPAVVTQAVPFTGLDDESTCPIQFIYQTEDTAI